MIDCHMHVRVEDSTTPEKRAQWAEKMRRGGEALGIDRFALIGSVGPGSSAVYDPLVDPDRPAEEPPSIEHVRRNNDAVAKYQAEHPDLFYGWARVDPRHGQQAAAEVRRCVEELNLVGVKHHFRSAPVNISDPEFEPVAEAAANLGVPIISHVQQRAEPQASEAFWEPESWSEDVVDLAERFPDLAFLSAHIGGGTLWEQRIKNIAPYDNVYLDTSGSNAEAGIVERAVDRLGVDRVVFGTDMAQVVNVGKLEGARLSPEEKATIAYNFESLLGDHVPNRLDDEERAAREEAAAERFAAAEEPREERIVDAFAFTGGHWPFQPIEESVDEMLALMDRKGVDQAVVSSINSVLYRNPQNGNRELVDRLDGHEDRFVPFATIDPTYPEWEADLETCITEWDMQGVRLFPEYHNYRIAEPNVARLMQRCAELDVPVMFVAALEDQRHKHDLFTLPTIESGESWSGQQVSELIDLLQAVPEPDVIIANAMRHVERIHREVATEYDDQDQVLNRVRDGRTLFVFGGRGGMRHPDWGEHIADVVGPEHLVTGPQLPFRYFESYYKPTEFLPVSDEDLAAVRAGNVRDVVGER